MSFWEEKKPERFFERQASHLTKCDWRCFGHIQHLPGVGRTDAQKSGTAARVLEKKTYFFFVKEAEHVTFWRTIATREG
jgi:hypothetical protein